MKRLVLVTVVAVIAALSGSSLSAWAAPPQAYTPQALAAAQAEGKPIIIHVTATWCSTCAAQIPIVESLLSEPKYKDLVLLDVDFDTQKSVLRALDVRAQSTFVAFKGKAEVGRSTGETDKTSIEQLFDKTT